MIDQQQVKEVEDSIKSKQDSNVGTHVLEHDHAIRDILARL